MSCRLPPIRPFEERLYQRLGIRTFKRYVPTGGDRVSERIRWHPIRDSPAGELEASLRSYEGRTRWAESVHWITAIIMLAPTAALAMGRHWFAWIAIMLNVAVNVPAIMLQRYNRSRIQRLLRRHALRDG